MRSENFRKHYDNNEIFELQCPIGDGGAYTKVANATANHMPDNDHLWVLNFGQ